MTSVICHIRT